MVRSAPVFAIIISIIASVLGYLLYIPHSEGVAQLNRIRVISAAMKTIKFVVSRPNTVPHALRLLLCRVK